MKDQDNLIFSEQLYENHYTSKKITDKKDETVFNIIDSDLKTLFSPINLEEIINKIFENDSIKIKRKISIEEINLILFMSVKNQNIINSILNILEYFQTLIDDTSFFDQKKNLDFVYSSKNLEDYFHETCAKRKENDIKDVSLKINEHNYNINFDPKKQKANLKPKESNDKVKKKDKKKEKKNSKNFPNLKSDNQCKNKLHELMSNIDQSLHKKKERLISEKIKRKENLFQNYYSMINNKIFFQKSEFQNIEKISMKNVNIPNIPRKKEIDISFFISMLIIYCSFPESKKIKILFNLLKLRIHQIENDDKDLFNVEIKNRKEVHLTGIQVRYFHETKNNTRNIIYKNLRYDDDFIYEIDFDEIAKFYKLDNHNKKSDVYAKLLFNKNRHYFFFIEKQRKNETKEENEIEEMDKSSNKYSHDYYLFNLENYLKRYFDRKKEEDELNIVDCKYVHTFLRNFLIVSLYLQDFIYTDNISKNQDNKITNIPNRYVVKVNGNDEEKKEVIFTGQDKNVVTYDYPIFTTSKLQQNYWEYLGDDTIMHKKMLFFTSETEGQIEDFSNYIAFNTIFKDKNDNKTVKREEFLKNYIIDDTKNVPIDNRKHYSKIFHEDFGDNFDMKILPINLFQPNSIRRNFINYLKSNKKVELFLIHMPKYYHYYYSIAKGKPKKRNLIDYISLSNENVLHDHKYYNKIFSQKKIYEINYNEKSIEGYQKDLNVNIEKIRTEMLKQYENLDKNNSSVFKGYYLEVLRNTFSEKYGKELVKDKQKIEGLIDMLTGKKEIISVNKKEFNENDLVANRKLSTMQNKNSIDGGSDSEKENFSKNAASISIGRNQSIGDTYNSYGDIGYGGIIEKKDNDKKDDDKSSKGSIDLEYNEAVQNENISISHDFFGNEEINKKDPPSFFSEVVDTNFKKKQKEENVEVIKINNENNNFFDNDSISKSEKIKKDNSVKEKDTKSKIASEKSKNINTNTEIISKKEENSNEIQSRQEAKEKKEKLIKMAEKILQKNNQIMPKEKKEDEKKKSKNILSEIKKEEMEINANKLNFKKKSEIEDADNISNLILNKENSTNNNIEEINNLMDLKRKNRKRTPENNLRKINNNESESKLSIFKNDNDDNKIFEFDDLKTESKSSKTKTNDINLLINLKNSDYDLNILKMDDEMSQINKDDDNMTVISNPYFTNENEVEGRKSFMNISDMSNLMRNNNNDESIFSQREIIFEKNSNFSNKQYSSLANKSKKNEKYFDLTKIKENYETITQKYFLEFGKMGKENVFEQVKFELVDLNLKINPKVLKFDPTVLTNDKKIADIAYCVKNFNSDKLIDIDEKKTFDDNLINVYLRLMNEYNKFLYEKKSITKRVVIFDTDFFAGLQECYNDDEFQQIYFKYKHLLNDKKNKLILDNIGKIFYYFI